MGIAIKKLPSRTAQQQAPGRITATCLQAWVLGIYRQPSILALKISEFLSTGCKVAPLRMGLLEIQEGNFPTHVI
jgi:hypothetical protein